MYVTYVNVNTFCTFDKMCHFDLTEKIKSKIATYKRNQMTEKNDPSRCIAKRRISFEIKLKKTLLVKFLVVQIA